MNPPGPAHRSNTSSNLSPVLPVLVIALLAPYPAIAVMLGWGGLDGSLGLGYAQDQQQTSQKNTEDSRYRSHDFRESLNLNGKGLYVLDPRLVTINLGAGIELSQQHDDFTEQGNSQDGRFYNYTVDSTFFSQKPYSLFLKADRNEDRTYQNFGTRTSITTTSKNARATLNEQSILKDMGFPFFSTTLDLNQRQINESSKGNGQNFRRKEEHNVLKYDAHKGYQTADLSLKYRFEDIRDKLDTGNDFSSHNVNLFYSQDFGPTLNRTWSSNANYRQRSGLRGSDTVTVKENLRIHHNVDLSSNYGYAFNQNNTETGSTTSNSVNLSVNHTLYGSLTSIVNVQGNFVTLPSGTTKSYGAGPGFSYHRKISEKGRLTLQARGHYQINDNNLSSNSIQVNNEMHQITADYPLADNGFLLQNRLVEISSIVVVDRRDNGQFAIIPGIDYEVLGEGDRTRIRALPGSALLHAGDPLEVSYRYQVAPSISYSVQSLSLGGGVDFGWLSFSVARSSSNQELLRGTGNNLLQDTIIDTAELRLNGRWQGLQASVGFGLKKESSTDQQYTTRNFTQSVSYAGFRWFSLTANLAEAFTEFTLPNQRSSASYTANMALNGAIARNWLTRVFAGYRMSRDSDIEDRTTARAGIHTQRNFAKLTFSADLLWSELSSGLTNTTDRRINMQVIRRF